MNINVLQPNLSEKNETSAPLDGRVLQKNHINRDSLWHVEEENLFLKSEEKARKDIVNQYKNDILSIALNDTIESGHVAMSEQYIYQTVNEYNLEYIKEAANELYLEWYNDSQVLSSILIMMGSLSYDKAFPQGQTMAIELLQHEDVALRDRAIQAFERWNSKKGLEVLQKLKCDRHWLQMYVDKVISYIERDGLD